MTSAVQLIHQALKMSGVVGEGQTPSDETTNDVLFILQGMMGSWNRKRWLVYHLVDTAKVSTGAQSYSVGPTGDFPIARPDKIEAAYARILPTTSNPVDWPLDIIESYEDYSSLSLKKFQSFPVACFLDSGWPNATFYPLPIPLSGTYELHIVTKAVLQGFTTLTEQINLPPEYTLPLLYNLSALIRPMFQLPPDPSVTALALTSLDVLRAANFQISRLRMPGEISRPFWGFFDPRALPPGV